MRILLTGATGQLGRTLLPLLASDHEVIAPGRDMLDLSNLAQVRAIMRDVRPEVVINPGAWTAVDLAESKRSTPWELRYLLFRHFLAVRGKPSGTILCSVKPCCFRLGFTVKHHAILRRGGCVGRAVGSMVDVRIAIADDRHGGCVGIFHRLR